MRHSVSSQKAKRSASEPPPRATMTISTSAQAERSCSARVIAGAACPILVIPRGSEAKREELLADAQAHAPQGN